MSDQTAAVAPAQVAYVRVARGPRETVHVAGCPQLARATTHFAWPEVASQSPEQLLRALPGLAPWMQPCHVCLPVAEQAGQQLDISTGAAEPVFESKAAAMRRAQKGMPAQWRATALQAIEAMAATGRDFQAWDLVEEMGLPDPDHPCRWGEVFRVAARKGLITEVGSARSKRPTTRSSLTLVWRGTEAVK